MVLIEEGQGFASFSSEVISQVSELNLNHSVMCKRVYAANTPIPTSRPLEEECLPDLDAVVNSVLSLFHEKSH